MKKRYRTPNRQNKKIKIACIVSGIVLLIAAAVILTVIIVNSGGGKPSPENGDRSDIGMQNGNEDKASSDSFDNGKEDPENTDPEMNGSNVDANELVPESGRSNGIDVSKWQGKIDWTAVKAQGVEFAFIRIGYRGENGQIYKDDNADYNIQQAQNADVLVGVYFFSTAVDEAEAVEEAQWVINAVKGYSISYPIAYDCEGYSSADSRMHTLTASERTDNALAFLGTVAEAGYDPMFYSALSDIGQDWIVSDLEKDFKIWIAQYPDITYPQKQRPDYSGRIDAWQFTNEGNVNGIDGNVDMVVCYFKAEKAEPKDPSYSPAAADIPLTNEEKIYTAVNETVTAKDVTNLRSAATTNSDIVGSLKNGETLTRTALGTNGWSKLDYNGQTVYAISSYLTTDLEYISDSSNERPVIDGMVFDLHYDSVTAKELVNLRARPTTDSEIVGTLENGTFLERTAVSDRGWSQLLYNGQSVYAVSSYLTTDANTPADTEQSDGDGFTPVDEQVTAKIETNLRTAPSADNSEVVYTLKNGEFIRRIGIHSNGWSKLEYNGQTVYAVSSYLITDTNEEITE